MQFRETGVCVLRFAFWCLVCVCVFIFVVLVFVSWAFAEDFLESTTKFNSSDVHPGLLVFLTMSMKFLYCLFAMSSFLFSKAR